MAHKIIVSGLRKAKLLSHRCGANAVTNSTARFDKLSSPALERLLRCRLFRQDTVPQKRATPLHIFLMFDVGADVFAIMVLAGVFVFADWCAVEIAALVNRDHAATPRSRSASATIPQSTLAGNTGRTCPRVFGILAPMLGTIIRERRDGEGIDLSRPAVIRSHRERVGSAGSHHRVLSFWVSHAPIISAVQIWPVSQSSAAIMLRRSDSQTLGKNQREPGRRVQRTVSQMRCA